MSGNYENDWYEMAPGIRRQLMSVGSNMMNMQVHFDAGTPGPRHSHPHEQITYIVQGRLRITINDEETVLNPGDSIVVPGGAPHSVFAEEEVLAIETFTPLRDEFIAQVKQKQG